MEAPYSSKKHSSSKLAYLDVLGLTSGRILESRALLAKVGLMTTPILSSGISPIRSVESTIYVNCTGRWHVFYDLVDMISFESLFIGKTHPDP